MTDMLPTCVRKFGRLGRNVLGRANWTSARVGLRRAAVALGREREPRGGFLVSSACTARQLESHTFRQWVSDLRYDFVLHRKLWEWAYISQALDERGMLAPGRRGLGFAVGAEPLPALFAARGCEVLATDLPPESATGDRAAWSRSGQYAASLEVLNARGVCPPDEFAERVRLRYVDMTNVPDDLTGFDFVWSSCSLEHLGTLEAGLRFVERSLRCLRPGGVAVHTTEFNVLSNSRTLVEGPQVIYRKRDLEELADRVAALGCRMADRDYSTGDTPADWRPDRPPYGAPTHLKLYIFGHVATSFGFIIEKPKGA
jgi:SAM-dependent methyltransferase